MAARDLTSGMATAIAAGSVRPAIFYEGTFANTGSPPAPEMLRLFTGIGTIDWNGYTWIGGGNILGISPIKEASDVEAVGFSVTISGLPSAKIDLALSLIQQGLPGKIWLGLFDNGTPGVTTYATFDPSAKNAHITLSNGNLTATSNLVGAHAAVLSTVAKSSGKGYCEITLDTASGLQELFGIGQLDMSLADGQGVGGPDGKSTGYLDANGVVFVANAGIGTYATWGAGDVISILLDADANTLTLWKNGVSQGIVRSTGLTGTYAPAISMTNGGIATANFGASPWIYTPPDGYAGWSETTSDIPSALIADPYMLRRGKFDVAVIARDGATCTIECKYEDRLIDLERPRARRYTSADQNTVYSADKGFDYVPSLQDMNIIWR